MSVEESIQDRIQEGDPAPDFSLPGTDGEEHSPDDFADSDALLIAFTCNHCPYAQAKIPVLNELADEYDGVAVVGINPNDAESHPDDSFERMRELVEAGEIRYDAYLRDEDQGVAKQYGAVCTPDPYLFRRENGEWVLAYHGRLDDALDPDEEPTTFHMREAIEAVLAGEPVEKEFLPSYGCSIKWKDGNEPDYW